MYKRQKVGRLQLLGIAIHIVGDTYAHKSKVDSSAKGIQEIKNIYNKNKVEINKYLQKPSDGVTPIIKAAKTSAGLSTSDIGQSYFNTPSKANKFYPDNTQYMAKRYSVATKVGTQKLINYYLKLQDSGKKYAFKLWVFCPYEYSTCLLYTSRCV